MYCNSFFQNYLYISKKRDFSVLRPPFFWKGLSFIYTFKPALFFPCAGPNVSDRIRPGPAAQLQRLLSVSMNAPVCCRQRRLQPTK